MSGARAVAGLVPFACLAAAVTVAAPRHDASPLVGASPAATPAATAPATATGDAAASTASPPPTGDAAASAPSPAPTGTSPVDTMSATDAYSEFRRNFDAASYADAVAPAERVLKLAEQTSKDPTAEDIQVAVMNLATTQYLAGDYAGAEANYQRAIQLVLDSGRPLHQRLARAYAGLGSTYHDGHRHDLAVKNYDQAVALLRRHEGLLTEQQVPVIEKYIDSLTELGRYADALNAQRYVLRIATRKYGDNDVRLAPTLEQIGRWFTRVGAYDQARRSLKRAIDLIEIAEGDKSPKLVNPLTAIAACARKQMFDPTQQMLATSDTERSAVFQDPATPTLSYTPATLWSEGERALSRAVSVAEERPDPSPAQVADVRTQLGDWYQSRGQSDKALLNYQQAWQAASRVTVKYQGKPLTEALFGEPVLLQIVRPESWDKYSQRPRDEVEVRNVMIECTVTPQGRTEAWKVNDDTGDAKRAERTIDSLKTARYRPRLEKGQPVAATGVVFSQPWIVLLDTAPAAGSGSSSSKPTARPGKSKKSTAASDTSAPAAAQSNP